VFLLQRLSSIASDDTDNNDTDHDDDEELDDKDDKDSEHEDDEDTDHDDNNVITMRIWMTCLLLERSIWR
jgi:ABC-type Zn2+ transport system substrate-binding protein/surface adhesin